MTAQNEQLIRRFGTVSNQDALSKIGNLSLSNNYLAVVNLPSALKVLFNLVDTSNIPLLCSSASLPGSTFATSEVKDNFIGVTQEFAHTRLYTDIDFTYYIDSKYTSLRIFEQWMDFISGKDTRILDVARSGLTFDSVTSGQNSASSKGYYRRFAYPDSYKVNMSIYKFERDFNPSSNSDLGDYLVYNFYNSFPKSLSATPVSYGSSELLQVTITMNYDRYESYVNSFGSTEPSKPIPPREKGRSLSGEIQQLKVLERRNTLTQVQRNRLNTLRREFPAEF